ncbi:MAG: viroplasmin family protein [Fusobacteriaceae bacterium]
MASKGKKFYAYLLINKNTQGITTSWDNCKATVAGTLSRYKSFSSEEEAQIWLDKGAIYDINPKSKEEKEKKEKKIENNKILKSQLTEGIYFDSGTGRGIGTEIRVTNLKGFSFLTEYFPNKTNEFGNINLGKDRTNNFGELAALYYALDIAIRQQNFEVFGDSDLVINFWSLGRSKKENLPDETNQLIEIVAKRRKVFEKLGGIVKFVPGDINPADLGFHKS